MNPGWGSMNNAKPVIYAAVGDSTGAGMGAVNGGYPARLQTRILQERPGSRLINLCVSGARSDELLHGQLDQAIDAAPDLVTLCIGINDVVQGVSVDTFAGYFAKIVWRLRDETTAHLVVANIPDISNAPAATREMSTALAPAIAAVNQEIARTAAQAQAMLVDVWAETRAVIPGHSEFFSDDGFHPSDVGYEYWARKMWPAVKRAIS
jgi:lysophospholipase L1-like esterase